MVRSGNMSGKTKLWRESAKKAAWILKRSRDVQGVEYLRSRFPLYQLALGQLTDDTQFDQVVGHQFSQLTENQFDQEIDHQFGERPGSQFSQLTENQFDQESDHQFGQRPGSQFSQLTENQFDQAVDHQFGQRPGSQFSQLTENQLTGVADDCIEVPENESNFLQLPIDQNDEFFPSVPRISTEYENKVLELISNEVKDVFEDCDDDSDPEQVSLIDVFDGSMDRQVEFEYDDAELMTVSEDAVCKDVDLFARMWPNLASKFLVENWHFYTEGVREERERTVVHGVTDPRLFSNLLTILSKAEEFKE